MIHDKELAMINAATIALEYKIKHPRCWDDDAVAHVLKTLDSEAKLKIYGVAAANEILKLKKNNSQLTDKQLLQSFTDNIFEVVSKIDGRMKN